MQLIASLNGKYFVESKYEPKYFVALKRQEKNRKKNEKKSDRENGKKPSFEPRAQHLAVAFH